MVETAIAATTTLMGDKIEGECTEFDSPLRPLKTTPVSRDMDTYVRKVPLGVCASISPFNFPAYVHAVLTSEAVC